MSKRAFFDWRDVLRLLGLSRQQVQRFVRTWRKTDTGGMGRCPSRRLLSPREVVALAIMVELRARGFSLPQAGAAARWFLAIAPWELSQSILAGRFLLLCVGDALPPPNRLMSEGEVYANEHLPLAELAKLPVPFGVVDVRSTMARVVQAIEHNPEPIQLVVPVEHDTDPSTGSSSSARQEREAVAA